jgi:predicted GNAT superfamily acetyltransferase
VLVEIPADFQSLRSADPGLALEWRLHSRALFVELFGLGYLVTDFVHLPGTFARSFYVLTFGESTL